MEGISNTLGFASTHWTDVTSAWVFVTRVWPWEIIVDELEARSGVLFGSLACIAFILSANSLLELPNIAAMSPPLRLAKGLIHPVVFTRHGPNFGGWILVTYCVAQAAVLVLAYTLYRLELSGKRLDGRLRELREVLA